MSAYEEKGSTLDSVEVLCGLSDEQQREMIADHYAKISNHYDPVDENHFKDFLEMNRDSKPPNISPYKIVKVIKKMNSKSSTILGDMPMKVIKTFADELALPLCHIINCCMQSGVYPEIWKVETITPVPKVYPPQTLEQLRKISGLMSFSKIMDSILSEFILHDMAPLRDAAQYGNVKGVSVQHYLIKMLHQILLNIDKKSSSESFAVLLSMIDWSQAFDRLSHKNGVQSFIDNGFRPSLIPILISFFQGRTMKVKWNKGLSTSRPLPGGTPQGGTLGILEYTSQCNNNTNYLTEEENFKFIDDLSILEIINLLIAGLSSYNAKFQVPSDVATENEFIHNQNLKTQTYLQKLSNWTQDMDMKLNVKKTNYMIFNTSKDHQFNTRLYLGVIITDDLKWHRNTEKMLPKNGIYL